MRERMKGREKELYLKRLILYLQIIYKNLRKKNKKIKKKKMKKNQQEFYFIKLTAAEYEDFVKNEIHKYKDEFIFGSKIIDENQYILIIGKK